MIIISKNSNVVVTIIQGMFCLILMFSLLNEAINKTEYIWGMISFKVQWNMCLVTCAHLFLLCTHQVKTFWSLNVLILPTSPRRLVLELVSVKAPSHCFMSMLPHQWCGEPLRASAASSVWLWLAFYMAEWLTEWESKDYCLTYLCDGVESLKTAR